MSFWGKPVLNTFVYEVTVGKSGDSAVAGVDYVAVPKFWINVRPTKSSGNTSFYLQPLGDNAWEDKETITIPCHGSPWRPVGDPDDKR